MTTPFPTNKSFYPGQVNANRYMPPALPGMVNGEGTFQCYPYTNTLGTLEQWTLTLPTTPDASATYSFGVGGYNIQAKTDASPTKAELAQALLNAVRADAQLFSEIEIELDTSTNNLKIWARQCGKSLAIALNPSGQVTNAITTTKTQAASVSGVIPFGRFVGRKSDQFRDPLDGYGPATLITATTGFEILGVTLAANYLMKTGRFADAQEGYPYESTMDVMNDTGTFKGVWIECVEPDIVIGDTSYIEVGSGKLTKNASNSAGVISLGATVSVRSNTQFTFGNRSIVLCKLKLAA